MGDVLMTGAGGGGVTSDDVTATRDKVVQGVTALTSDSDDEPIEGAIIDRGGELEATKGTKTSNSILLDILEGWYHKSDGKPKIRFLFDKLISLLGIDFNKVLTTQEIAGKTGTIIPRGFGQQDTSDFGINSGKAYARFDPGYYESVDGVNKPWVWIPFDNIKATLGVDKSKMLSSLTIAGETGTIPTHTNGQDAWDAQYDSNLQKMWARLPLRNGYYANPSNDPWLYIPKSMLINTLGLNPAYWLNTYNVMGTQGQIPRWVSNTGDVINAYNNEAIAWDDAYAGRGRMTLLRIPNGHYIEGANWVGVPTPWLQPHNIRAGITAFGLEGTMQDYGAGRVAFNGATFDGVLMSGVADNRSITLVNRFTTGDNFTFSGVYVSYQSNLMFNVAVSSASNPDSASTYAVIANYSLNLAPFQKMRCHVSHDGSLKRRYNGINTHIDIKAGAIAVRSVPTKIGNARTSQNSGQPDIYAISVATISAPESTLSQTGHVDTYFDVDLSGINEHAFLFFGIWPVFDMGSVANSTIKFTKIEFIN